MIHFQRQDAIVIISPFAAELLGFKQFIPPFPKAVGRQLLEGVNYASAGSGIRQETSKQQVSVIPIVKNTVIHN